MSGSHVDMIWSLWNIFFVNFHQQATPIRSCKWRIITPIHLDGRMLENWFISVNLLLIDFHGKFNLLQQTISSNTCDATYQGSICKNILPDCFDDNAGTNPYKIGTMLGLVLCLYFKWMVRSWSSKNVSGPYIWIRFFCGKKYVITQQPIKCHSIFFSKSKSRNYISFFYQKLDYLFSMLILYI